MSRCRYLDMFLTICLKKGTRVLSELSSTQRCHPKESQNTKILPPVLIVASNSPVEWEAIRETSSMLALRCHSLFYLLFLPFKTKKTRKKRRNQQGKQQERNFKRQCIIIYNRIHGTGKYLLNNLPIQKSNPSWIGKFILPPSIFFAKSMGFIPGSIPVAISPP